MDQAEIWGKLRQVSFIILRAAALAVSKMNATDSLASAVTPNNAWRERQSTKSLFIGDVLL